MFSPGITHPSGNCLFVEAALQEISHHRPLLKNHVDPQVEAAVIELALELPAYGQIRIAKEVLKRHALSVSLQGVRSIWLRHAPGDHEQAPEGAGGEVRPGRTGADRIATHRA